MHSCTYPTCDVRAGWARDLCCRGLRRDWRSCPGTAPCSAMQIRATARFSDVSAVFHNKLATRKNLPGVAAHTKAFKHRIINTHIVRFCADGVLGFRIPNDNVGVASSRERSLLWVHAK